MKRFLLGGARSGKSALAQQIAAESHLPVTFIATATASDEEMAGRIRRHQQDRPPHWSLVEEPVALAGALREHAAPAHCVVVDCLTLWWGNLTLLDDPARVDAERDALLDAVRDVPGEIILVSNEIGMGIVPAVPMARTFRDELGILHQALAERCDAVALCVAGLPLWLKKPPDSEEQ